MKIFSKAALIALASLLPLSAVDARDTDLCSTTADNQIALTPDEELYGQLYDLTFIRAPRNALSARLWEPLRVELRTTLGGERRARLHYPLIQDIQQIASLLRQDPFLAAHASSIRAPLGGGCFPLPLALTGRAVEYVNDITGRYYLSSEPVQSNGIDSNLAGPGWRPTGLSFGTTGECPQPSVRRSPVYKFYAPAVDTHFLTSDPQECATLRRHAGDWAYEGVAFLAARPVNGACPADDPKPVYRLFNDRAAEGSTNHRFTTDPAVVGDMIGQGWIAEGVAFCVPPQP